MRNEKLIEARVQRGWTQEDAAEGVGVSRTAYARWEEQGVIPHISTMKMASEAFKMTPEQLGFRKYPTRSTGSSLSVTSSIQRFEEPSVGATVDMFQLGMLALVLAQQHSGWSFEELRYRTEQEMRRLDVEKSFSRRQALEFLIHVPAALAGLTLSGSQVLTSLLAVEELIPIYVTAIPACWKLYYTGPQEWLKVERVLPTYISHLTPFAQQASKHQKIVVSLLSQAHQLGAEISMIRENFSASLAHCKHAFFYGQMADDANLQAASLIREANTLFYHKRPVAQTNLQALQYAKSASPLLQGRIYSEISTTYAESGQEQDALRYMGLAHDHTPDHPGSSSGFCYTHSDHYILHFNDMFVHLEGNRPKEALNALTKASTFVPDAITPRKMELLKHFVIVGMSLNDLEFSKLYFEKLVVAAKTLQADLHFSEAYNLQEQMSVRWPHELQVKRLVGLLER